MLEQATQNITSEHEEKAKIIASVFGKKTSVVYDTKAICDLFQKDGLAESMKELLANLLFVSLVLTKQTLAQ